MHQHTRRLAVVIGGSVFTAFAFIAACSSENTAQKPSPASPVDGSKPDTGKPSPNPDGGDPDDPSPDASDAAANCDGAPKLLDTDGGVFCFGAGSCAEGTVCCSDEKNATGGFADPRCASAGSCNFAPDAGGLEWQCTKSAHCPNSGEACCVTAGTGGSPQAQVDTKFPGCGTFFNSGNPFFVGGSRCRDNGCNAGELTLCARDEECEAPAKCRPFKLAGRFTGVCK